MNASTYNTIQITYISLICVFILRSSTSLLLDYFLLEIKNLFYCGINFYFNKSSYLSKVGFLRTVSLL